MNLNNNPFPFQTIKEAWDYFTKSARMHFAKLVKGIVEESPEARQQIKALKHKDYCARLLYILNMFAFEGDHEGEFDIDWAMLIAKPLSAAQARKSIMDLISIGLMGEIEETPDQPKRLTDGSPNNELPNNHTKRHPPAKSGGEVGPETDYDFDE